MILLKLKKIVDHIDRNSFNNHVDNLRWVTYRENRLNSKDNTKTTMMYRIIDENGNC